MANAYLRFWGVRGSYAAPYSSHMKVGGNTSCIELHVDDHVLICDAGTGIIPLGRDLMVRHKTKELLVLLTHYHWDHICGLPFFLPAFTPDWRIRFFGPGETTAEIKQNLDSQMQAPYFPVGTETWNADISYIQPVDKRIFYGPFDISWHNVHHPGVTYGYCIKVRDKVIAYTSDNECRFLDKSIKQHWTEFDEEEKKIFEKMNQEEYQAELKMIQNADILIHDAQYTPEDYETKQGWGHSCYTDTVNMAIDANSKSLYLYHHDPFHDDKKINNIHKHCLKIINERQSTMQCHIAREGMTINLDSI